MKFVCVRCNKIVNSKDVLFGVSSGLGLGCYCSEKCYKSYKGDEDV